MSNFLIAFLFAGGGGTWIYNKMHSRTGGNTQHALIVAGASGVILFLFMLVVLSIIGSMISDSF